MEREYKSSEADRMYSLQYYREHRAERKAYWLLNHEHYRALNKANYEKHKLRKISRETARKFGISVEDVIRLWKSPCGICGVLPEQSGRISEIDHDHSTGQIRGALCETHNKFVGFLEKHRSFLDRALLWIGGQSQ